MARSKQSKSVVKKNHTILDAAVATLKREKSALGPTEIADAGIRRGLLRIQRGRTKGYLAQLIQSTLQADATKRGGRVFRPRLGKYKAKV